MIIAIVYDHHKPDTSVLAHELQGRLRKHGHEAHLGINARNISKLQMAITLGGDGLIMHVANQVAAYGTPILRINFGHVGFMANIEPEDAWAKILEVIEKGNYIIVRKTRLEIRCSNGQAASLDSRHDLKLEIMNDIVIERTDTKVITTLVSINGECHEFRGDGIIVFTKNGSTAYNVSAGGRPLFKEKQIGMKVISPTAGALPDQLVCSDKDRFEIRLMAGKARLVADGKKISTMDDMKVLIGMSKNYTYFIEVGDKPRIVI